MLVHKGGNWDENSTRYFYAHHQLLARKLYLTKFYFNNVAHFVYIYLVELLFSLKDYFVQNINMIILTECFRLCLLSCCLVLQAKVHSYI